MIRISDEGTTRNRCVVRTAASSAGRAKLSPAERATFTQRRKDAYEALHPEIRHGASGGTNAGKGRSEVANLATSVDRFTADTASKTGRSERDVQRDAAR